MGQLALCRERICADAPEGYGLLITFEAGTLRLEYTPDAHLDQIHPNGYGPSSLTDLCRLGGGGSGVRVFAGHHPRLGPLVMKHGGYKDTRELFSLAKIAETLRKRDGTACRDILNRIPEFKGVYISPKHLRKLPRSIRNKLELSIIYQHMHSPEISVEADSDTGIIHQHAREIRLFVSEGGGVQFFAESEVVDLTIGPGDEIATENESLQYGAAGEGYPYLETFVEELASTQKVWLWKLTLAQKRIGGSSPRTVSSILAAGELHGIVLQTLISEFVQVLRSLQSVTLAEEEEGVSRVRLELAILKENGSALPGDLSAESDAFVGFAIVKNWHPETGRFIFLRRLGQQFRSNSLHLEPEERIPCSFLAEHSCLVRFFAGFPQSSPELDKEVWDHRWLTLLEDAVNLKGEAALKRVFNCGLADAGIHNLFLSSSGQLWLFDLGAPTLQPLPAVLTKFLFSFFHTLGMEEECKDGVWKNRFVPGAHELALTEETKALLPKACDAFRFALDYLIEVLFDGEESVRALLIKYVTIQLLSDAAFCLEKWTIKGGGRLRDANHNKNIVEWLWRPLWDIYVASYINTAELLTSFGLPVQAT